MKAESNLRVFMELMVFEILFVMVVFSYGFFNSEVNCNPITQDANNPYNVSDINEYTSAEYIWAFFNVFSPQCSGIPYLAWLIVFLIPLITILVYILPSWIAGGG